METDRRGIDVVEGEPSAEDACSVPRADALPTSARELGDGISQIGVFTEDEDHRDLGELSFSVIFFLYFFFNFETHIILMCVRKVNGASSLSFFIVIKSIRTRLRCYFMYIRVRWIKDDILPFVTPGF